MLFIIYALVRHPIRVFLVIFVLLASLAGYVAVTVEGNPLRPHIESSFNQAKAWLYSQPVGDNQPLPLAHQR